MAQQFLEASGHSDVDDSTTYSDVQGDEGAGPPVRFGVGLSSLLRVAPPDLQSLLPPQLPSELQHVLLGEEEEVEWFQSTPSRRKLSASFVVCVGVASLLLLGAGAALIAVLPSIISYILFAIVCVFTILCWSAVLYRSSGTEIDFVTNIRVGKVLFNGFNTISCISAPFEAVTDVLTDMSNPERVEGSLTLFCDISFSNLEFKHVSDVNILEAILTSKIVRRPTQPLIKQLLGSPRRVSAAPDVNTLRQGNRKCLNQFLASHPDEGILWVHQLSLWQTMGPTLVGASISLVGAIAVGIALYREICCNRSSSAVAILVLLFSVFSLLPLCLLAMSLAMGIVGRVADAISSHSVVFMRRGVFCFPLSCCNRATVFSRPSDVTLFPIGTHVNCKTNEGKIVFPRAPNLVSSTMDHVPSVREVERLLWTSYLSSSAPRERINRKTAFDETTGGMDFV